MYKTCFETVVGSHAWNMQREDSDTDTYRCYIAPAEDFLLGLRHARGHESQTEEVDRSSFEIGHVINQLKKGNLNHIVGVMSGIVNETSMDHAKLRLIVENNMAKNAYKSIHGMAFSNYKRYFEDVPRTHLDENEMVKKLGQVGRILKFGVRYLTYQEITFEAYQPQSRWKISRLIEELNDAYDNSTLPENPDDEKYNKFLLDVRRRNFKNIEFLQPLPDM